MSDFTPSRRTLAKGAVWTGPAVVIASAAPAFATTVLGCPSSPGLRHTIVSAPTFTVSYSNFPLLGGHSVVQLNLGSIDISPSNAPAGTTGFYFEVLAVTATDNFGGTHAGSVRSHHPGPYVMGPTLPAGGALNVAVGFEDFDYNGPNSWDPDWDSNHHLRSYVITYRVTYLNGLTPIIAGGCAYSGSVIASPNATYIGGTLSKLG